MPISHLSSSPETTPSWELPGIKATISNNTELNTWRETLYRSMTDKSSSAISRFLGVKLGVIEMMQILNKRGDKTKKSKWATLQTIIRYQRGYSSNTEITKDDIRTELESIDRDFSKQRTIRQISDDIKKQISDAQMRERDSHLSVNIAGFETPIIGATRGIIIGLLDATLKSQGEIIPPKVPQESPKPVVITPILPPPISPISSQSRTPMPRRVDAATLHQAHVATIQRERTGDSGKKPFIPAHPIPKNTPAQTLPTKERHPNHDRKSNHEIIQDHRASILEKENALKILQEATERAKRRGKFDDLIFEGYIRGKDISILTILQAIKRLGSHRDWMGTLEHILPSSKLEPTLSIPETQYTAPAAPPQDPIPEKTPPILQPKIPEKISKTSLTSIQEWSDEELEKMDFETLFVAILERQEWMNFLHALCQLHRGGKYGDFIQQWGIFKENETDITQKHLWDALDECSAKKEEETKQSSSIINIMFELCGYTFSSEDRELYSKHYTRKNRGPEIWGENAFYQDVLLHLEDIHSYEDLIKRIKTIIVKMPDKKEWFLYEEKICPPRSLQTIVESKLANQYPTGPGRGQEQKYLRDAKKHIRSLAHK